MEIEKLMINRHGKTIPFRMRNLKRMTLKSSREITPYPSLRIKSSEQVKGKQN